MQWQRVRACGSYIHTSFVDVKAKNKKSQQPSERRSKGKAKRTRETESELSWIRMEWMYNCTYKWHSLDGLRCYAHTFIQSWAPPYEMYRLSNV